jgi:hypothetical protein
MERINGFKLQQDDTFGKDTQEQNAPIGSSVNNVFFGSNSYMTRPLFDNSFPNIASLPS